MQLSSWPSWNSVVCSVNTFVDCSQSRRSNIAQVNSVGLHHAMTIFDFLSKSLKVFPRRLFHPSPFDCSQLNLCCLYLIEWNVSVTIIAAWKLHFIYLCIRSSITINCFRVFPSLNIQITFSHSPRGFRSTMTFSGLYDNLKIFRFPLIISSNHSNFLHHPTCSWITA